MKDYKQYNSTIKSVKIACEQAANGYHLSEGDLRALGEAISDLESIYNTRSYTPFKDYKASVGKHGTTYAVKEKI